MNKEDSIHTCHDQCQRPACVAVREAYAAGRKDEREKVAWWMIQRSYATGHGETTEDMLAELDWQIAENWNRAMINGIAEGRKDENEACAKVAESYEPRCDSCPSGVANAIRARREQ